VKLHHIYSSTSHYESSPHSIEQEFILYIDFFWKTQFRPARISVSMDASREVGAVTTRYSLGRNVKYNIVLNIEI